jgi:hypothetical protein
MVVNDFNLLRSFISPDKTDPQLFIDADTVLSSPITGECFQSIARRYAQRLDRNDSIELIQLTACHGPEIFWTRPSCASRTYAIEDILSAAVLERLDQRVASHSG